MLWSKFLAFQFYRDRNNNLVVIDTSFWSLWNLILLIGSGTLLSMFVPSFIKTPSFELPQLFIIGLILFLAYYFIKALLLLFTKRTFRFDPSRKAIYLNEEFLCKFSAIKRLRMRVKYVDEEGLYYGCTLYYEGGKTIEMDTKDNRFLAALLTNEISKVTGARYRSQYTQTDEADLSEAYISAMKKRVEFDKLLREHEQLNDTELREIKYAGILFLTLKYKSAATVMNRRKYIMQFN